MSQITIKIVEVDPSTHSVVVKFVSENSKKSIDEYDGLAFQVPNYESVTPEQFIKEIKVQVSNIVKNRDAVESRTGIVDISDWNGYTTTIDGSDDVSELVDPFLDGQAFGMFVDPEVKI